VPVICKQQKGAAVRRFRPPWSVEELNSCFVVKDSTGQKLGYFHYERDPGRRLARKQLSRDEALQIAGQLCEAAGFGGRDILGF
jgi:hypothetical protein